MIDAGTIPLKESISKIITYMDKYKRVGGACGEIEVFEPTDKELGYGWHRIVDPKLLKQLNEDEDAKDLKDKINKGIYQKVDNDHWYEVKQRS